MMSELEILQGLKMVLERDINDYTESVELDKLSIEVNYPDIDNMRKTTMIFLQPNYADYDALTYTSDQTNFTLSLFIVAKRDKPAALQDKVFDVYNAVYKLLKKNNTLDSIVGYMVVQSMDYYPALTGTEDVKGIEVSIQAVFEKDWAC